jgi:signal transduction histidine kinase
MGESATPAGPIPEPLPVAADRVFGPGLLACALAGSSVVALQLAVPAVSRARLSPVLYGEVSIAAAAIALLAALLVAGRFRRTLAPRNLFLAAALALFGLSNLVASVFEATGRYAAWAPALCRIVGAALLVASAFAPRRALLRHGSTTRRLALACVASIAAIAVVVVAFKLDGQGMASAEALVSSDGSLLSRDGAVLALKIIGLTLFTLAAVGFAARQRVVSDWLGALAAWGTTLLAFGWLSYLFTPSQYQDWLIGGTALRTTAYALVAVGAMSTIRLVQRDAAQLAAMAERERVARDLHDGLAQELVYMLGEARHLGRGDPAAGRLVDAAQRALDEVRMAISAFRASPEEPLASALERLSRELSRRLGLNIELRVPPDVQASPQQREVIMRIVAEALSNAARHGGAHEASVELVADDELRLRVRDDGSGFDPAPARSQVGSYGLRSMRERAALAGGRFTVSSAPGSETEVEVVLP